MLFHPRFFGSAPWVLAALLLPGVATAQALRTSDQLTTRVGAGEVAAQTVDYIVALVNSEPITQSEVRRRVLRVEQQYANSGVALPPRPELGRLVMEQLIGERAQQQAAQAMGIRVDEAALVQAEQTLAAQNGMDVETFRQRLTAEGVNQTRLREELRGQILLQRVRDREVQTQVRVTEADIDARLRERQAALSLSPELRLAHILVLVPESAGDDEITQRQARAQQAAQRARQGADFAALAREFSDAPEAAQGGDFGWRSVQRLPSLFVQSTLNQAVGEVVGPVRSPAGFHVLKLVDRRQASLPEFTVTQTRARHMLLRVSSPAEQQAAVERLGVWRQQVLAGQARFEDLAREHSQDGSAREGGDLGWVGPGQFVPEFEAVMDGLAPGELSGPVVSRFGVHLIRVEERRASPLGPREQRAVLQAQVQEQKAQEVLQRWAEDVRSRAFVEYREEPRW